MAKTGKMLTSDQVTRVKAALDTPLVALQCGATKSPQQLVHAFALETGLPEIRGYYGADLETGDILR